ncbi:MAG: PhoH family protein [Proteobacteria bacterium]|nr:PhoH family protein [Pseudomonadota bacterium]
MSPPTRSSGTAHSVEPLHMTFDDNAMLPALFGRHDEHLARIEQSLGVALVSRGNQLAISGPPWSSQAAKLVLTSLLRRLERGLEVDAAEVSAAVRMVVGGGNGDGAAVDDGEDLFIATQKIRIGPRSPVQAAYLRALRDYDLVFALGPAGTGKTYLAVAQAVAMLIEGRVERIVLSRPAVEAGENLGFLPGDVREKIDPYLRPLYDALHDMMPGEKVRRHLESGDIEVAPLAFMRGRTLSNAYFILDEAQNTSPVQMKMCLTRLGENSRMAVTGDLSQIDLPKGMNSGLNDAVNKLKGVKGVTTVTFSDVDVVRHGLVTRIIRAYDKDSGAAS